MKEIIEKHIEITDEEIVTALGLKGITKEWSMSKDKNCTTFRFKLVELP